MRQVSVGVYAALNRLSVRSGVPRHIVEVVSRLLQDSRLSVSFFTNAVQADQYLAAQGPTWTGVRQTRFAASPSLMQKLWAVLDAPSYEWMGGSAEWLYLPADAYVPTRRARLAITIHDVFRLEPPPPHGSRLGHIYTAKRVAPLYKRIARGADVIFTVSRFSADRIRHHLGVPASRIEVVYNGVSPAFFSGATSDWQAVKRKLDVCAGEYFVHVGGLKSKKNGEGVIAAWEQFSDLKPDFKLVLAGHHDPALLHRAERRLKRVCIASNLSDHELASLLSRSVALLFPSFYEGFGLPVVEAFAAGTQAVVSDHPVLREIGGDVAIYVDPADPSSIVQGMLRVSSRDDERADRIMAGRAVAMRYNWEKVADSVASVLCNS